MATKTKIEKRLSKPEKVTNEQLNKIQTFVGDLNKGQFNLGNLELQKHRILHAMAGLQDQWTLLRNELEKEYGSSDVNVQDGVINYKENGEADKKD